MKILLICLLLTGCSQEMTRAVSETFKGAGAAMSQDVYNAQNGLPQRESNTDPICMMDCTKRYSWDYCTKQCSY